MKFVLAVCSLMFSVSALAAYPHQLRLAGEIVFENERQPVKVSAILNLKKDGSAKGEEAEYKGSVVLERQDSINSYRLDFEADLNDNETQGLIRLNTANYIYLSGPLASFAPGSAIVLDVVQYYQRPDTCSGSVDNEICWSWPAEELDHGTVTLMVQP